MQANRTTSADIPDPRDARSASASPHARPASRPGGADRPMLDELCADLRAAVRGDVSADHGARALYAYDASHYRQLPVAVVLPRDVDDVVATVAVCRRHRVPILPRGGGTSLAGQGCNAAVVLDFSRHLNGVLAVDPEQRTATVEPGCVLDDLQRAAAPHGLTFGPDPSTHGWCTLGGMIGNNACGVHSVMAGRTVDNVESLDVLTPEGLRLTVGATTEDELTRRCAEDGPVGELYRGLRALRDEQAERIRRDFPVLPRRVSGFNLDELLPENGCHLARALTGSEGTCVTILSATVRLVPNPPARALLVLGYPDLAAAADDVPRILARSQPIGLEGTDGLLVANMRAKGIEAEGLASFPDGDAWLMVEFGGETTETATAAAEALRDELVDGFDRGAGRGPSVRVVAEPGRIAAVWKAREAAVGACARMADGTDTWPGWEDAAVPVDRLADYLRAFDELLDRHGLRATIYGHFGQGCVHARIDFDMASDDGVRNYRAFVERAADLVASFGGSLSGEHGDGHARAELLPRMFGDELVAAFARFRALFDPHGLMNPGKVVAPYRLDEHLSARQSVDDATRAPGERRSATPERGTEYTWPDDDGRFARAATRCVGVGKCRGTDSGTMCPSYMVTHDERHSTRGRARLLAELADGRLPGGWSDEALHEALDLCLACKGCKRECPAGVDVATYKSEVMAQRWEGRLRPLRHYAFGWFHRWARLGSLTPGLVNTLSSRRGLGPWLARLAGAAPDRPLPRFARRTFVRGHRPRRGDPTRGRVLLWPDTFTNHLRPEAAHAAVAVMRAAGFEVELPARRVCCGRPLYDFGMLRLARKLLNEVLDTLGPALEADLPIVVLEPSCLAVFRDEARNLFPDDPRVRKLRERAVSLATFLARHAPDWTPPPADGSVLLHGHCHQEAVGDGIGDDRAVLERAGFSVDAPDTGCCGMAGSFGFDARHQEVARAVGERVLLPAVRALAPDTPIVTDGFSCREQIAHATDRRALHLAEVLADAGGLPTDGRG